MLENFSKYGFHDKVLPLLTGFQQPSPIQAQCWPILMSKDHKKEGKKQKKNRDLVGIAETGSGKTLAFSMPILSKIVKRLIPSTSSVSSSSTHIKLRALVITPTRELALQIVKVLSPLELSCPGLSIIPLVGGEDRNRQIQRLTQRPLTKDGKMYQMAVGTPGRLKDLLDSGHLHLNHVKFFVLDEADRMLDAGFEPEIRALCEKLPKVSRRQTSMFSATWPFSVQQMAGRYLKSGFSLIRISNDDDSSIVGGRNNELKANLRIEQIVRVIRDPKQKEPSLLQTVKEYSGEKMIIFVLYKKEAPFIERLLKQTLFKGQQYKNVYSLHGDLPQSERNLAMKGFTADPQGCLIATDVAARGLDISDVTLVINYTFPLTIEDYVHRIGRTGRAGRSGVAITYFTDHDKQHAGALVGVLKASNQPVPLELTDTYECVTKRKVHKDFGSFYRPELEGMKGTHIKFEVEE